MWIMNMRHFLWCLVVKLTTVHCPKFVSPFPINCRALAALWGESPRIVGCLACKSFSREVTAFTSWTCVHTSRASSVITVLCTCLCLTCLCSSYYIGLWICTEQHHAVCSLDSRTILLCLYIMIYYFILQFCNLIGWLPFLLITIWLRATQIYWT